MSPTSVRKASFNLLHKEIGIVFAYYHSNYLRSSLSHSFLIILSHMAPSITFYYPQFQWNAWDFLYLTVKNCKKEKRLFHTLKVILWFWHNEEIKVKPQKDTLNPSANINVYKFWHYLNYVHRLESKLNSSISNIFWGKHFLICLS